jgi:aldehyde oxidoreductase
LTIEERGRRSYQPLIKGDDPEEIFKTAAHVVEGKYYLQRQPHLFFEPDNGFAYTDEEGRITIHSKSIALYLHALMIAEGLGVEEDKLRMVQNYSGGTFGYKFCPTMEGLLSAATMATGRPVYLKYGKFLAMQNERWNDHGPYMEFGDNLTSAACSAAPATTSRAYAAWATSCAPTMAGEPRSKGPRHPGLPRRRVSVTAA